jgi:hypothetical protein
MESYTILRSAAAQFVYAAALAVCFFFAIRFVVVGTGAVDMLYNSDAVHPFLYAGDLLRDPATAFTWYNPPSFYVVPDMTLALTIVALGVPAPWQPIVFSTAIATLLALAAGFILREITGVRAGVGAWAFAGALFAAGAVMLLSPGHSISTHQLIGLFVAYAHSGALVMSFWGLFIVLLAWRKPGARWTLAALAVLSACATFSDLLFAVWFSIPVVVTGLFAAWATRSMRPVLPSLATLAGSAAGYALDARFNTVRSDYLTHRSWFGLWEWVRSIVRHTLFPFDVAALIPTLLFVLLAGYSAYLAAQIVRTRQASTEQLFIVLIGCASGAALLAPLLTRFVDDLGSVRYFLAAIALPLLWIVALALKAETMVALRRPAVVAAPVVVAAIAAAAALYGTGAPHLPGYDALLRCLKKAHRNAGFADYWNSMSLMQASARGIQMFALTDAGKARHWNVDGDWLQRRADNGKHPQFNFIIPERLDENRLKERFGNPDAVSACGRRTLWFYQRPIDTSRL